MPMDSANEKLKEGEGQPLTTQPPGFVGAFPPQIPADGVYPPPVYTLPPFGARYPPQNYPAAQPYGQVYGGGPLISQPGAGSGYRPPDGWMNMPQRIPNCPPGLEYLASIDQLLVKQKVEMLEAFTGFETNNKFTIKNSLGQKVYWAVEQNDCCTRNCCGASRPFEMKIMDIHTTEVLHLYRPLRCASCWCPCCLQTMEVSSPPGNVIGTIEQNWSLCIPSFDLKDQSGQTVLQIKGPLCQFSICGDVVFKIMTVDGHKVGEINKQWSGFVREALTDADHFGISFPLDLDVRIKAVLLGACFLIDMMYFEKSGNENVDRLMTQI